MTNQNSEALKTSAAANVLGISSRTLRDYAYQGRIRYFQLSKRLLMFRRADLDAFVAQCERPGGAE